MEAQEDNSPDPKYKPKPAFVVLSKNNLREFMGVMMWNLSFVCK
jgi:hypothetical protein